MSLHNMLHLRVREQSIFPSLSLILLLAELYENSLSQSALKMALQVSTIFFIQKFIISSHVQWLLETIWSCDKSDHNICRKSNESYSHNHYKPR